MLHLLKFTYNCLCSHWAGVDEPVSLESTPVPQVLRHHEIYIVLEDEKYHSFVKHGGQRKEFGTNSYQWTADTVLEGTTEYLHCFLNDSSLQQCVRSWINEKCQKYYLLSFHSFINYESCDETCDYRFIDCTRYVLLSEKEYRLFTKLGGEDRGFVLPYEYFCHNSHPVDIEWYYEETKVVDFDTNKSTNQSNDFARVIFQWLKVSSRVEQQ